LPTSQDPINLHCSGFGTGEAILRTWALIATLGLSGCASTPSQPSVRTIERIETWFAVSEDVQAVGVRDSESMNRAARTRVRNLRCSLPQPGLANCTYETARRMHGADWGARRRTYVRREQTPFGTPHAHGWAVEETPGDRPGEAGANDRPRPTNLESGDPSKARPVGASPRPPSPRT